MKHDALRGLAAAFALAATAAVAPRPAAAVELELAYLPILPMAQLLVMEGEGWTKAAGLDLKLTRFSSGPAEVQALASGKFDAAYVGIGPTVVARSKGIDLKVVASGCVNQVALIARGDLAKSYGGVASPAAAFAAFHKATGHPVKIATLPKGSTPDTVLRYWLEKTAKVAPADYEIVGMGEERVQQALLAGSVDAASILEPILTIVQKRDPGAKILVRGSDLFPNQPGAVVAVRERTIKAKADAVQKLVALHIRATKFIKEHPDEAAKDIEKMIGAGLVAPDVMLAAVKSPMTQPVADPEIIVGATKALLAFQQSLGVTTKVDLDALFDPSFYKAATK
ncbi:MAG TPA: ABC transporter substrate-binding protein [Hyphomicrobiales bacterium]|nr:ABC transporter substrate-binding protein [Hyphomicrobiales bacterium]